MILKVKSIKQSKMNGFEDNGNGLDKNCFEIKNLVCSYDKIHPVLYIPELEIPRGKICVLFGKSGSGKSTLLETLGLMTDTIALNKKPYEIVFDKENIPDIQRENTKVAIKFIKPAEKAVHQGTPVKNSVCYIDNQFSSFNDNSNDSELIWDDPLKQKDLRDFHFSFVFQETNLMPNFSSVYNVAIPEMLTVNEAPCKSKGQCLYGAEYDKCNMQLEKCALTHARYTLINDLHLNPNLLDRLVLQLSGGQRQRVAFARALNSRSTVLFGDEPTGNLDKVNSQKLMDTIQTMIHGPNVNDSNNNPKKTKSAIIVSHDLNLSLKYADLIICLTSIPYKEKGSVEEKEYGRISRDQIFEKVFVDSQTDPGTKEIKWRSIATTDTKHDKSNSQMDDHLTGVLSK